MWRALGAEQPVSHLVLAMLLGWLQKRPLPTRTGGGSPQPKKAYLRSLAVSLRPHHPRCPPSCLLECVQSHMGVRHPLRVPGPREGEPHTQAVKALFCPAWPGQGGLRGGPSWELTLGPGPAPHFPTALDPSSQV